MTIRKKWALRTLWEIQNGRCLYCRKRLKEISKKTGKVLERSEGKLPSIDHIIPSFRGGKNNWENKALACRGCNVSKGHKLLEEMEDGERYKKRFEKVQRGFWKKAKELAQEEILRKR